ncbi:MAG: hypothetical protein AAF224_06860 [Pseudomonadota bacterium]
MRFFAIAAPTTLCAALLSAFSMSVMSGAAAGELLDAPNGARIYVFKECAAPTPFVIDEEEAERLSRRPRERSRALRRYDVYVAALNAYFECMQEEAQTDLNAVYGAVDTALQTSQNERLAGVDILRRQLRLDEPDAVDAAPQPSPIPNSMADDEALEDALLGAE